MPEPPDLSQAKIQTAASGYYPGGEGCKPEALPAHGTKAASQRDACTQAAEQHRLDTYDLLQQTRAADAAQAGAVLAYRSLVVAVWGMIFGFATLLTAIAAVWFAKRAADASDQSVKLALETSQAELRAYLGSTRETASYDDESRLTGAFHVSLKNKGTTPAHSLVVHGRYYIEHDNGGIDDLGEPGWHVGTLSPDGPTEIEFPFKISLDQRRAIETGKAKIVGELQARYLDAFGAAWCYDQHVGLDDKAFGREQLYTFVCRQYRATENDNDEGGDERQPRFRFPKPIHRARY